METVVACIIEDSTGQVLLSRSTDGRWEFPSGAAKRGESAESAMRRVAQEKLGVSIDVQIGQPPLPGAYEGRPAAYRFFIAGIERGSAAAVGVPEIRWTRCDELAALDLDPLTARVVEWYMK